jgi:PKD repeat protein
MALIWVPDLLEPGGGHWVDTNAPGPGGGSPPPPVGPPTPIPGDTSPGPPIPPPLPIPQFSYLAGSGFSVRFISTSLQATHYKWFFGDGSTATFPNVVHAFPSAGTYAVRLRAYNSKEDSKDQVQNVTISSISPYADFNTAAAGRKIFFYDKSTVFGTSWLWDFGDGSTSTVENPSYTYTADGTYSVTLSVGGFSVIKSIAVSAASGPTFAQAWSSTPYPFAVAADSLQTYVGCSDGTLQIWDKATPPNLITSFLTEAASSWSIRQISTDGTRVYVAMHATISSVVHDQVLIYDAVSYALLETMELASLLPEGIGGVAVDGAYIYATDEGGAVYRFDKITFAQDMGFSCANGQYNLTVDSQYIYGATYNEILISDIGDGSLVFTLIDGTHISSIKGISVDSNSIYIVNSGGNHILVYDKVSRSYLQTVSTPPTLSSPQGSAISDSILYVADLNHQTIQSWTLGYSGDGNAPLASFSMSSNSGLVPFTATLTNLTTGDSGTMTFLWEFGDDSTSTDTNPTHEWITAGTYTVRLTATNILGKSISTQIIIVKVSTSFPANSFIFPVIGDVIVEGKKIQEYAVDHDNNQVLLYDQTNTLVTSFGIAGAGNGQFNAPENGCQQGGVVLPTVIQIP